MNRQKKSPESYQGTTYSTIDIIAHFEDLFNYLTGLYQENEELPETVKNYYSQMIEFFNEAGSRKEAQKKRTIYNNFRKEFQAQMKDDFTDDLIDTLIENIETAADDLIQFHNYQRGGNLDNKPWKTDDYIDFFKKMGYSFKRNLLDDSIEHNGKNFDGFTSAKLQNITADSLKKKVTSERYHNIIMDAAGRNAYNPILDYFNSVKDEDDSLSQIDFLSKFFKTNDDALFSIYLKKWLVGAVAKAYTGEQNAMLVLDGKQGIGKSQFAKWMNPIDGYFHEGAIIPDNKDYLMNLTKFFIWEVSELGATTRKADREALKDFITKEVVIFRSPYAKQNTKKHALASFVGTINNEAGFLTDPSGNRRFNVITIKSIDWNYTKLNINEVWSEAYNLYQSGYDYKLTHAEAKARDALNGEYIYKTHVDDLLDANIITGDSKDFIPTAELVKALKAMDCKGSDDSIGKKVSSWMQRNEIEICRKRINGKNIRGFRGIKENFQVNMINYV